MAKSSTPSRLSRNAPQPKAHRYIDALFTDDFGRRSKLTTYSANSFAKKKYDAASQALQVKGERREKQLRRIEIREWRAAERSVAAEQRESDHRIRLMWRTLNTKVRPEKTMRHTPPRERQRTWPYTAIALPKYDGPVIDRNGQRGVFMRVRYYSRRTAEQGVSQRLVKYVFNGAECDIDGDPYQYSNVGQTIDETLCGFDHLEQVNWSAAKNAKLLMHGIFAVDHRQTTDEMMECGKRWAEETLGRFHLPYLVTLHAPPPDGDSRNWHLHVLWSFRPMMRTGDHAWQVAEMLRTDLDNPAAMKVFREMYAVVMTDVSFQAGQNQIYTAKSNADRGLPHEPQIHLGAARTNQVRNGEYIAANEENHERVMRSKAAVLDDHLRHVEEALARQQATLRAFVSRWARLPSLPMQVPQRVLAATFPAYLPDIGTVPAPSSVAVERPADLPTHRSMPARIAGQLAAPTTVPRPADIGDAELTPPVRLAQPAGSEIANLRNSLLRPADAAALASIPAVPQPRSVQIVPSAPLPVRARTTLPSFTVAATTMTQPSFLELALTSPPATAVPASSVGALMPVQRPLAFAVPGLIEHMLHRLEKAWAADKARRKRERDDAERTAREAAAAQEAQQNLERLLVALEEERHHLALRDGRPTVDPDLLAEFNLAADQLTGDAVQERLARIDRRNAGELSQIHHYVTKHPDHLIPEDDYWTLRDTAPADVRKLVSAWRNDRTVQAALARLAGITPTAPAAIRGPAKAAKPKTAWHRARYLREEAMAAWDVTERRNRSNITRPGSGHAHSGEEKVTYRADVAHRVRRLPGAGLGD